MKVFCTAFMCLQFGFVIFWQKDFGAKAAHKMLVKLTPVISIETHEDIILELINSRFIPELTKKMFNKLENAGAYFVWTERK